MKTVIGFLILTSAFAVGIVRVQAVAQDARETAAVAQGSAELARQVAADLETERQRNLTSSCIQANVERKANRDASVNGVRTFAENPAALTPIEQAVLDAYAQQVYENLPYRDCTKAGIEAYYADPPPDPALEDQ